MAETAESAPARVHLVLSGGGIRCLAYAGAIRALADSGVQFATVSACSAGTFIGALLSAGIDPPRIEEVAREFDLEKLAGDKPRSEVLAQLRALVRWPHATYAGPGMSASFCEIVEADPTFDQLQIPLTTAAIDLLSNKLLVYSIETTPSLRVSKILDTAIAIPFLYPPDEKTEEGRMLVDAALASNSPVWMATRHDEPLPIVVLKFHERLQSVEGRGFGFFLGRVMEAGVHTRDSYMFDQIPRVRTIEIDTGDIRFDDFDLDRPQRSRLITAGADAARQALRDFGDQLDEPERHRLRIGSQPLAEDAGRAIRGMQRMMGQREKHVFISYSHRDGDWLERFETYLKPYVRNGRITIWNDEEIATGDHWKPAIDEALASTRVALLLVTENYLASDFVANEELPYFEEASRRGDVRVLWVPIRRAAWEQTSLVKIQAVHDLAQPLGTLDESDLGEAMTAICNQVAAAFGHPGSS